MKQAQRSLIVLLSIALILIGSMIPIHAESPGRPEVRALWVDAFHNGIKTPAQVEQLVKDALTGNINTLIVQVRRRGDAYYHRSIEPRTEDPALQPGFDALQYLIEQAHANRIEVHAWLNTLVAWNRATAPLDPKHIWNAHGPTATGRANWISYYRTFDKAKQVWSEQLQSSYYLDPGHPDLVDYTAAVYLEVVKNYDVDGIHLDYSRYAGKEWGYNPTSIARYQARYGTTGLPAPDDPQWAAWRREQTANLVRKIYLQAIALKPKLKVSSAVITWGDGPVTEADWERSRAYTEVFQDWRSWLQEGILDLAVPMNYFRDFNPAQQLWYNRWIEWEKDHQYGRQIVIGPGSYAQYIEDTLYQIRRAQSPSNLGNYAAGVSLYTYGTSHLYSNDDYAGGVSTATLPRQPHRYLPESNDLLFTTLTQAGGYWDPVLDIFIPTRPVFSAPAAIPDQPWKTRPQTGFLMGVVSANGKTVDHLRVTVEPVQTMFKKRLRRLTDTDGNGWFGLTQLPPGRYRVTVRLGGLFGKRVREIQIQPGRVSNVKF